MLRLKLGTERVKYGSDESGRIRSNEMMGQGQKEVGIFRSE